MKQIIKREAMCKLPTRWGEFIGYVYKEVANDTEHMVLVKGDIEFQNDVCTRIHSECLTGDIFGSERCDCGEQLALAQQKINNLGQGIIIYLRNHEGRGIGLSNKIRAYALQQEGLDTVDANIALGLPIDARQYYVAAAILQDQGINSINLLSNNPQKLQALTLAGVKVSRTEPLITTPKAENMAYLDTKKQRMGHTFPSKLK